MSLAYSAEALASPPGQVARFALHGSSLPRTSATLAAEAFRAAVLSALHAATGRRDSFLLSGHDEKGNSDREHRHAYYLPLFAGEKDLAGLLVVSPRQRFSPEEIQAVKTVRAIRWGGPSTRASVELIDPDDRSCFQVATRWVSVTPFAPLRRFWGTSGKHHLVPDRQLVNELANLLPDFKAATVNIIAPTRARLRLRRNTALRPQWQLAFNIAFQSETPICGPIALGHSCHFGLGLFVPAQ